MLCERCNKVNRDSAGFCAYCGGVLNTLNEKNGDHLRLIIGMNHIKIYIEEIIRSHKNAQRRHIRLNYNTLILGNPGTGKSHLGRAMLETFHANGIITSSDLTTIDCSDLDQFLVNWSNSLREAKGSILYVDNADKLFVESPTHTETLVIERLNDHISRWGNDPIVILAGLPEGHNILTRDYPDLAAKFSHTLDLNDYSAIELADICISKLINQYYFVVTEDAHKKILNIFNDTSAQEYGNAHVADDLVKQIINIKSLHSGWHDKVVIPSDIPEKIESRRDIEDIFSELDYLEGLRNIKEELRNIIAYLKRRIHDDGAGISDINANFIITGNLGVGKTTISRVVSEIFRSMGILTSGQVIRVKREDLISDSAESSKELTNTIIDNSLGGILYIERADLLLESGDLDDFGIEIVETLKNRLIADKGRFVCFLSGNMINMDYFLNLNPSLKELFTNYLHITDLNGSEMAHLFRRMAKNDGIKISEEAELYLDEYFEKVNKIGKLAFQNAIAVKTIYSTIFERFNLKIDYLKDIDKSGYIKNELLLTKEDIMSYD